MEVNRRNAIALLGASAVATRSLAAMQEPVPDIAAFGPPPAWFTAEPMRIAWCILRQVDGRESGAELIDQAAAHDVNLVVVNAGGVVAFYPTRIPYHELSDGAKAGNDLFGDASRAARAKGLRTGARFDFSRLSARAMRDHPEWFYKRLDGSISGAQGRFRPCLNGEFYHKVAPAIVMEAFDRYRPSLLFLNNFSNVSGTGEPAPCQCDSCKAAWAQTHPGTRLPTEITADYSAFIKARTEITAMLIAGPLRRRHPDAVIINADAQPSDGLHTESRIAIGRSIWPYETGEAVDRQLNSHPDKLSLNICTSYSSNYARLVLMPPPEVRTRMFQSIAAGSPPIMSLTGTFAQYDRATVAAAKDVWGWYKRHGDIYVGAGNAARVLLLCRPSVANRFREGEAEASERGLYQILSEHHVPIATAETSVPLRTRPGRYDLVLVSRGAPMEGVRDYVARGGTAVFVDQHPGFAVPDPVGRSELSGTAYWRIRKRDRLPGFPSIDFVEAGGGPGDAPLPADALAAAAFMARGGGKSLTLYPPDPDATLTLVPPMIENIAEEAAANMRDTDTPGLIVRRFGKGRVVLIPWDLGGMYTRFHLAQHAQLLMSILHGPADWKAEIETDAPQPVQLLLTDQPARRRRILHAVNLAGQSQHGYNDPPRLPTMQIAVKGRFAQAESRALGRSLPVTRSGDRTVVTLPQLDVYDAIVLTT